MTKYVNKWQFVRSTDMQIISIAKQYDRDTQEWRQKCDEFQQKHHVELAMHSDIDGNISAKGVSARKGTGDLPGQWCQPRKGVIKPYESNTLACKKLKTVSLARPALPGIDRVKVIEMADGMAYFCGLTYFLEGNQVWAQAAISAGYDSDLWQSVPEWQYRQAKERRKMARKAKHV